MTAAPASSAAWRPSHPVPRYLLRANLPSVWWLGVPYLVVVAVVTALLDRFGTLETDVWAGALQLPRWFALGLGVYLTAVYLPLFVAHGRTRREGALGAAGAAVVLAAAMGVFALTGFLVEYWSYRALGWEERLTEAALTPTAGGLVQMLLLHTSLFLVWMLVGAMCGAAFYRGPVEGIGSLLAGLLLLGAAAVVGHTGNLGPFTVPVVERLAPPIVASLVCLGLALLAAALAWSLVRDLPLRPKN